MRPAFTLIELLVVIAIIAILAAFLFPVFAQVRAKGRQAVCLSNMKQIANAFQMYTSDFDERFPQPTAANFGSLSQFTRFPPDADGTTPATNTIVWYSWAWVIQPYMKSANVLECPSATPQTALFPASAAYPKKVKINYTYNRLLSWRSEASVTEAAGVYLAFEGFGNQGYVSVVNSFPHITSAFGPTQPYVQGVTECAMFQGFTGVPAWNYRALHNGMLNAVFVDGHAKSVTAAGDIRATPFAALTPEGLLSSWWTNTCGNRVTNVRSCPCVLVPDLPSR